MSDPTSEEIVKRAVKEALMDKSISDLGLQMTDLSKQMAVGFSEVHQRQDQTNGKVLKNTTDIAKIDSKDNYDKLIWFIVTTLVGLVVYFMTKGH